MKKLLIDYLNDSNNINKLHTFMLSWIKHKLPTIPDYRVNEFLQRFLNEMVMVGPFDKRYSEELNSLLTQAKIDLEVNVLLNKDKQIVKYI